MSSLINLCVKNQIGAVSTGSVKKDSQIADALQLVCGLLDIETGRLKRPLKLGEMAVILSAGQLVNKA